MHQIHYHQLRPHLLTVVTVPLIGRPWFPPPLTTRDPILHDDVKGHQQQLSLNRREESTFFHTMFKLEIFLAFYTIGQAFFGLAMFACIGYLVWICRREDGETLNPLNGSFKEDGEPATKVVLEKLKSTTESVTTLFSNSNSPGTLFELIAFMRK